MIGRHNYYTGAVFEVYAAGLGFTVANGGRYDNLLKRFGQDLPATGFAIYLERLLSVLPEETIPRSSCSSVAASKALRPPSPCVPRAYRPLHLPEDLQPDAAMEYASSVEAPGSATDG
jgi:ATP phosphoribosyltransferase regulatory subunit